MARFSARSVRTCADGFWRVTRTSRFHVVARAIWVVEADELLSFFYQRGLVAFAQRLEGEKLQYGVLFRRAKTVPAGNEPVDDESGPHLRGEDDLLPE